MMELNWHFFSLVIFSLWVDTNILSSILILIFSHLGLLVTGSWDQTVKLWDPREKKCIGTHEQNERVSIKLVFVVKT